jgi:hypothetical protein
MIEGKGPQAFKLIGEMMDDSGMGFGLSFGQKGKADELPGPRDKKRDQGQGHQDLDQGESSLVHGFPNRYL